MEEEGVICNSLEGKVEENINSIEFDTSEKEHYEYDIEKEYS